MRSLLTALAKFRARAGSGSYLLVLGALAISATFKLAAFGREAYIASRFGVSSETDLYFALQQLPMSMVTFVLGAFGLAFTPAYTSVRRSKEGQVWTSGILFLCISFGLLLTALTLAAEPLLLNAVHTRASSNAHLTVVLLALSYVPVLIACVWVCVSNASGRPLLSLTAVGIPYLLMTITLVMLCFWPQLQQLSLPASWLAGFTLTASVGVVFILRSHPGAPRFSQVLELFGLPSFQGFLRQLGSSVLENAGFLSNQLLLVFFFGLAGTGAISANNYAMRIGMLGYGMLTIPLAQLTQSRLCNASSDQERARTFIRQLLTMALVVGAGAATLGVFRTQVASLVYLRGQFSADQLHAVVFLLPAWFSYFVVISLNAVASRLLFIRQEGMRYTQTMLAGYALANVIRLLTAGHTSPDWIVWAAVVGEGLAFAWNLRNCLDRGRSSVPLYKTASPAVA